MQMNANERRSETVTETLHLAEALLPEGFASDVKLTVVDGTIASVEAGVKPVGDSRSFSGIALPGMPNLHSHAFQRGMAGLSERRGAPEDSFWTWREVMYRFLDRLDPDDVQAIAAQAFVEMLEGGFTALAEFHYLHHDKDGRAYANIATMGQAIASAAQETGLGLTLLPVLYRFGNFGQAPSVHGQRRFVNAVLGQFPLETVESPQVVHDTAPGIIRAGAGVENEGPVAGLRQQQFPPRLLERAMLERPGVREPANQVAHSQLGGGELAEHPFIFLVEPHAPAATFAPARGGGSGNLVGRMLAEVVAGRN